MFYMANLPPEKKLVSANAIDPKLIQLGVSVYIHDRTLRRTSDTKPTLAYRFFMHLSL